MKLTDHAVLMKNHADKIEKLRVDLNEAIAAAVRDGGHIEVEARSFEVRPFGCSDQRHHEIIIQTRLNLSPQKVSNH